jgi:hypothetical protein
LVKVKMEATAEDVEKAGQDQGEFVTPPNGYYVLALKECNHGLSKDNDGNEDKNRPRLECIWEIVGVGMEEAEVTENYGNVWDYVSWSKESGWHRAQFLRGVGLLSPDATEFKGEFDTDDLIGKKIIARLAQQRGQTKDDPKRAKIRSIIAYEDRDTGAAFGGDGGGTSDEGDAEDYTEEELMAKEPKELGAIAKEEFDLDPAQFVVKVRGKVNVDKSKAALVEGILQAQAEEEEEEDSGEAESPF